MSIEARSAASRCTRSAGPAEPADPQPAPHRLGQRANRDDGRVESRRSAIAGRRSRDRRTTRPRRRWSRSARAVRSTSRRSASGTSAPVGLWKSGMRYASRGVGLAERGLHLADLPAAAGGHRHRDDPRAVGADRVEGAGVGGQLGEHPVARADAAGAAAGRTRATSRWSPGSGRRRSRRRAR